MDLHAFEDRVRRTRPTEITAEVVAGVRNTKGRSRYGAATNPKLADIPGGLKTGTLGDMFAARFSVDELEYAREKPSDERWLLKT